MHKNQKFGAFYYQTENIGDNIQTLAMMRFIPRVDYLFDRDNMNATNIDPSDNVKLIMNGWYMQPIDRLAEKKVFDWPPKSPNIDPLLISMYFERDVDFNRADLAFLTNESKEFLNQHGPVGARDIGTERFLNENGIKSYYSGCMTLTLLPDKSVQKQDFILAVDVSDPVYEFIRKHTTREIIRMNTFVGSDLSPEEKNIIAKYWLTLYQSAHTVVTTRLHTMLPCLALQTPVLAIRKNDKHRFEGLIELVNNCTENELLNGKFAFNFDDPKTNPKQYLEFAEKLAKTCKDFTGYDEKKSYLGDQTYNAFITSADSIKAITQLVHRSHDSYITKLHDNEMTAAYKASEVKLSEALDAYHTESKKLAEAQEHLMHPGVREAAGRLKEAIIQKIHK